MNKRVLYISLLMITNLTTLVCDINVMGSVLMFVVAAFWLQLFYCICLISLFFVLFMICSFYS